jgi:hypothetical protein
MPPATTPATTPPVGVGPSTPVGSPVPPVFYPPLAVLLLLSAGFVSARFAKQLHSEKRGASMVADVTLGAVGSALFAGGTLFLLAWVGLYV